MSPCRTTTLHRLSRAPCRSGALALIRSRSRSHHTPKTIQRQRPIRQPSRRLRLAKRASVHLPSTLGFYLDGTSRSAQKRRRTSTRLLTSQDLRPILQPTSHLTSPYPKSSPSLPSATPFLRLQAGGTVNLQAWLLTTSPHFSFLATRQSRRSCPPPLT